jgi:Tol biopolymer transport system component/predicted Ser/Thr protein kinase
MSPLMLDPGTSLGPYTIESVLGSGGMGDVYLATDTRLNRKIAIKTLLEEFSSHADWKQRFKQEAQAVASLSHANICTLHDVGHADGVDFLVMEYLDGQNLSERLKTGPLSIDDALKYAMQIADALHKTHRKGVIHGDLKPGNVMLTKSGVKLLDFGLAQLREVQTSLEETNSLTLGATRDMMGTPQYMAPEQVEQKGADSRSDIFAFGALLYEMLTAEKAFQGTSTAGVFAAILREDPPPVSTKRPGVPKALERIVAACLVKDPDERWQDAGDLYLQLRSIRADQGDTEIPVTRRNPAVVLAILALVAAGAATLGVFADRRLRDTPPPPGVRFSIRQPEGVVLGDVPRMALSPDGRHIAFAAGPSGGRPQVWVRRLDSPDAQALAGTDNVVNPFWSYDGRSIGFLADGKIRRIDATGGPVQVICDGPQLDGGGTWNKDNVILFSGRDPEGPIMRVSAAGGTPEPVTSLKSGETSHRWPRFLPDGRHFLFLATDQRAQSGTLYVGSLDGTEPKKLFDSPFMADFADGHLLFKRDLALIARPFDPATLEFTGEAVPVSDWVGSVASSRRVGLSTSTAGYVAFSSDIRSTSRLVWLDRNGRQVSDVGAPPDISHIWLAPDEKQIATDSAGDVWFIDPRGVQSRITLTDSVENQPVWSHDGTSVIFSSSRDDGISKLYRKSSSGLGEDELVLKDTVNLAASDISPDGKYLLFQKSTSQANTDLYVLPLAGGAPMPVQTTPFDEIQGRFSPDGKWIAFVTNESGQNQVNIRSFPSNTRKVQVSVNGGVQPRWRRDSKELYYVSRSGTLMSVGVNSVERLDVGLPQVLFDIALAPEVVQALPIRMSNYAVNADGSRFLAILQNSRREDPITILQNWTEILRQRK